MKPLIAIINVEGEPDIISQLPFLTEHQAVLSFQKPVPVEIGEWLYKGYFIQESSHPNLVGKYEIFKNSKNQEHIARAFSFKESLKIIDNKNKI